MENTPKRIRYKNQEYRLVENKKLKEDYDLTNLVDQISQDADHEITEKEYLEVISDRLYDTIKYDYNNGRFRSLEDVEELTSWLNRWVVDGKARFR